MSRRLVAPCWLPLLVIGLLWIPEIGSARQPGDTKAAQAEPTMSDLPPPGTRSLFDHHIARLGALPYPYAALIESFQQFDRWDAGTVALLVPDGRSLRRAEADFQKPRALVAAQVDAPYTPHELAPVYAGRLFLGFVEAANEIEVISYNEAAGRFEYQLVANYCAGCVPRIVYAKRAICLTCHQAGAPIFSARPWDETNANAAVAREIARSMDVPWLAADSTRYHGVALSTQILTPETFDELTVLGAENLVTQRIWIEGCGVKGLQCRRSILAQALALVMDPGGFNPESADSARTRLLQKTHWPAQGIPVPESLLPSRDPMTERNTFERLLQDLRVHVARWRQQVAGDQAMLHDSDRKLAFFAQTTRLDPLLDPRTPRPPREILRADALYGVQGVARLFTPNDRRRLQAWSQGDVARVSALVHSGALDELLDPKPVVRAQVLQTIARLLGQPEPAYCCLDTTGFSPPRMEHVPPLRISAGSVLETFQRYCFGCHRGNPVQRLNFMGADTEAAVLASIRARTEIRDVLDYARFLGTEKAGTLMPPQGSEQRTALDAARNGGSADHEKMRETVPALFDF